MPALRLRDQKVAEHLHARDRLEFFRIDEIGIERDRRVGLAEQLHQSAVLLDQISGSRATPIPRWHARRTPSTLLTVSAGVRGPLPSRATSISQRRFSRYCGTVLPPSSRTRWLSRSSSARGVPNRLMYSGEA